MIDTKLVISIKSGDINHVIEYLKSNCNDVDVCTAISLAEDFKYINMAVRLCDELKDINSFYRGITPLMRAALFGITQVVHHLIDLGAMLDKKTHRYGETALMFASRGGSLECALLIIQAAADVNARDAKSRTSLFHASEHGYIDIGDALIDNGAVIEAQDYLGYTPLILAARRGKTKVVQQLIERGADVHAKDHSSLTALQHALLMEKSETAELIAKLIDK